MADTQDEILKELQAMKDMTHEQQKSIDQLVRITGEQSAMVDKMWRRIDPILKKEERREELKQQALVKIVSGGVWAMLAGFVLVAWQGFKFYVRGE